MSPATRVRLGDFTIVKKIGEGGMGTVYMARQESLERIVALKILPRQFAENPEFVERFRREARAAASLVHTNVVQIYHVGEERGVHYFAMEYVEGQSLEAMLADGRGFAVDQALDIVMHVAKALEVAAEKGIVHRDIKPANVMIDRKGVIKVMDFGLAKPTGEVNDITQPGLVIGTPSYMSPEQGQGSEVDCRSDIYALGTVLYKLLTGEVPFTGDNPGTVIYKHLHEAPKPPSELDPKIPAKVDGLVLKCLAKKPEERFATPAELLAAIARVRSGETQTDPTIMMSGVRAGPEATTPLPRPQRGRAPGAADATVPPAPPLGAGSVTPPGTSAVAPKRGRARLVAAALALVLAGAGVGAALYLKQSPARTPAEPPDLPPVVVGPGPSVVAPKPPEQTPAPPATGKHPELCTLRLSALSGALPKGTVLELVTPQGKWKNEAPDLRDLGELPAGPYTLNVQKRGYAPLAIRVELSAQGTTPALGAALVKFEPAEELLAPYGAAEKLLAAEKVSAQEARKALEQLAKVEALDGAFRQTVALRRKAEQILAGEDAAAERDFAAAEKLAKERKWAEARDLFEKVPADHRLYGAAREQINSANKSLADIAGALAELKGHLEGGKFTEADAAMGRLGELSAQTREVKDFTGKLDAARKLWDAAGQDFREKKYPEAKAKYEELQKSYCPNSSAARDQVRLCQEIQEVANETDRLVKAAEGQLVQKDFPGCLATLADLAKKDLGADDKKRLGELRARAEAGQEESRVAAVLGAFDAALVRGQVEAAARLMDQNSRDFAVSFEKDARELFAAGLAVAESSHRISRLDIIERAGDGSPGKLRVQAAWKLAVRPPAVGQTISGNIPQTLVFNAVRGGWLLGQVAPGADKPEFSSAPAPGAPPAPAGMVTGKVVAVEGELVVIDRGAAQGVTEKMVFNVFSEPRAVRLPLTAEAPVFVEERAVAAIEAVKVEKDSARCAFRRETGAEARAKVKKDMLVATSTVPRPPGLAPVVTDHQVEPKEARAAAGEKLTVSVGTPAAEGAYLTYRWSADAGMLSAARTAEPKVEWTAPAKAGKYKLTITVESSRGERSAPYAVELQGAGPAQTPPKSFELADRLGVPGLLEEARDVAFDEKGRACVLDAGTRKLLRLDADGRVRPTSTKWPVEFTRLAARGEVLYCLDAKNCLVKRYPLEAPDPFAAKPLAPDLGGKGEGNGRLRSPVDLAVAPNGDLLVLDAAGDSPSVQVFSATGAFAYSFGSGGAGPGALKEPVAVAADLAGAAYVLDAGRRRVAVFRGGRPAGDFACADKTGRPVDLAYDPATDSLLVLDAHFKQVALYSTAGERRAAVSLGLTKAGPGELSGALRLAAGAAGDVLVISGEGKHLDRFATSGEFLGRLGGEPFPASTRLACGADGLLWALDCKSGLLRRFDPRGWLLAESGEPALKDPVALACDPDGRAYVLDAGDYAVLAFEPGGKPAGRFAKKGTPPAGLADAVALAALRPDTLMVACSFKQNGVVRVNLEKQETTGTTATTAKPRLVAVDGDGAIYAAGSSGQVERYDAEGKSVWTAALKGLVDLQACGRLVFALDTKEKSALACEPKSGQVVARAQLPAEASEPRSLAAGDIGVVYVYDAATKSVLAFRARR